MPAALTDTKLETERLLRVNVECRMSYLRGGCAYRTPGRGSKRLPRIGFDQIG
jgi:hypothetical protein